MNRLPRLERHRFVGVRDTMKVYDCEDHGDFEELRSRVESEDLINTTRIQTFAPDTLLEAENRGFRPV